MYLSEYDLARLAHERMQAYLAAARGDAIAREQRRNNGSEPKGLPSRRRHLRERRLRKARI